jgi:hypothetical protein
MSMQSRQPHQKKTQYKENTPDVWEMQKDNVTLSTINENM